MAHYRSYSRFRIFQSKKPIAIRMVGRDKFEEAVLFMRHTFLEDPFIRSMGISARHKETQNYLSALWLTLLKSELSLAAISRNKICGLCINCRHTYGSSDPPNDVLLKLAKLVKTDATRNLLRSWHKISIEAPLPVAADGQKKSIMELAGLAVASQYRKKGIAQKLVQNSGRLAMLLGFDYARIDCTNIVTSRICDRLGWEKIWQMPYKNFDGVSDDSMGEKSHQYVKVYLKHVQSSQKGDKDTHT